jgi:hypothetical protein
MKLKLAIATLGLSLLSVSAFAQGGVSIVIGAQQNNAPGILDYNADFSYTGAGSVFIVPNGLAALTPGTGYTDTATGLSLGLFPLQLGDLGGGNVTGTINELVFSLNYDNTAVDATGVYDFFVYDGDPFGNGQVIGTVSAPFAANIGRNAVPEPGTVALLVGMGVAGIAVRRRRK